MFNIRQPDSFLNA